MKHILCSLPICALLALTGCAHVFEGNLRFDERPKEFLPHATLVVVGVIEEQKLEPTTRFRAHVDEKFSGNWRVLRRRIRVESVLFGSEPRKEIDVYEVFGTGGATGNWNATEDGDRAVFPLREEGGYYRLTGDWWRSIFPVTTGRHDRLPLDDSRPLWERIALMNWWIPNDPSAQISWPYFDYADPADTLSLWRVVKLERGLVRHPSPAVRVPACLQLLRWGYGQDECWESLSPYQREHLRDDGSTCCSAEYITAVRANEDKRGAAWWWTNYSDREIRRLLTAHSNHRIRTEICRLYNAEYPGDTDTGCPADRPPPATIVTEQGDVPLVGDWPR